MLSEVAMEPKPAKSTKQPEPIVPPKEEPAKKGTMSVCAHSFFLSSVQIIFVIS